MKRRPRRPSGSTVFIAMGVLAYLALRELPPDNSLGLVQNAGILRVCHPQSIPPYIQTHGDDARGLEADLAHHVARSIGTRVSWNLQAGWGAAPDPVDWGLRPESCDVLAGGIVISDQTEALMKLLPYRDTRWVLVTRSTRPRHVAVLLNHWGLPADAPLDWAYDRNVPFQALDSAPEALTALRDGTADAALALEGEARWLLERLEGNWRLSEVPELPRVQLALGVWKNRVTLKRAIAAGLQSEAR